MELRLGDSDGSVRIKIRRFPQEHKANRSLGYGGKKSVGMFTNLSLSTLQLAEMQGFLEEDLGFWSPALGDGNSTAVFLSHSLD